MRLSPLRLAGFAAPSLPLAALYFPVYVFLAEFYSAQRGLSLEFIGGVLIAVRLFDAISDPVMGWASDRVRTPFGRRRPWLVLGAPVVMLSAWALFVPPEDAGGLWFAVFITALTFGWTVMLTPYFAWGAELSGGYSERARITVWRDTAGLIGTILAALLYNMGETKAGGMMLIAAMIVILLPLGTLACLIAAPEPADHSSAKPRRLPLAALFRQEPLFLRLLLAYFLNGAANALPATLFLFFVGDRLGAPDLGGPLLVVYFGAAVLAAPVWTWAVRRYSKHRIWCIAMIYASIVFAGALFLGPGDLWLFAVICCLSGAALGADLALPASIQADLVDRDTAASGEQRTGQHFAIWSLVTKASLAVTSGLALILLGWIGFSTGEENARPVLAALAGLYAGAPIVLKLMAVAVMWSFPLDRAGQAALRARIEAA